MIVAHKRFEIIEHELFHSGETIALLKTHENEYIDLEELITLIADRTSGEKDQQPVNQDADFDTNRPLIDSTPTKYEAK